VARQKAERAVTEREGLILPEPEPRRAIATEPTPPAPEAQQDAPLEGLVLDPVARRNAARDAAWRYLPAGVAMLAFMGGG
jgi:hypothetical protein